MTKKHRRNVFSSFPSLFTNTILRAVVKSRDTRAIDNKDLGGVDPSSYLPGHCRNLDRHRSSVGLSPSLRPTMGSEKLQALMNRILLLRPVFSFSRWKTKIVDRKRTSPTSFSTLSFASYGTFDNYCSTRRFGRVYGKFQSVKL